MERKMTMVTRVTEICGLRYPVFLGPMMHISLAPLVSAFSQAGGLGCLACAGMGESMIRSQIAEIRRRTASPFAANVTWNMPQAERVANQCLEERVGIIISSGGMPVEGIDKLKSADIKVFQVVANVAQALKAESLGVDGIIVKGFESGGLSSLEAVASLPLIPTVVDAVSVPVIAAGGIGDGRGMAAALALGADGVLMGTRFLACTESPIHPNYKKALVQATDTDTLMVRFPGYGIRFWKNKRSLGLKGDEPIFEMTSDFGHGEEVNESLWSAGQVAGLIRGSATVEEILCQIMESFVKSAERLGTFCPGQRAPDRKKI